MRTAQASLDGHKQGDLGKKRGGIAPSPVDKLSLYLRDLFVWGTEGRSSRQMIR
jgi:hypothetical protein